MLLVEAIIFINFMVFKDQDIMRILYDMNISNTLNLIIFFLGEYSHNKNSFVSEL